MKLFIIIPLILMIVSDFRTRTVTLWQLGLFGLMMLGISLFEKGIKFAFIDTLVNLILFILIGICICIYFWVKYKSIQSIIGKGDLLFIILLTPYFTPRYFLVFMLISFIATLIMWSIYILIRKDCCNIPLISGVGICLCILIIYQQLMQRI